METVLAPLHRAGWPFIALFSLITLGAMFFSQVLGFLGLILTGWCVYFFRNPVRVSPLGDTLVLSPADGIITKIEKANPPKELKWETSSLTRVSIFLNIFDVHVTRSPVKGVVSKIKYHPGKFLNASLDKASEANERNSVLIKTEKGQEILVVQIAGLIARRILCDVHKGHELKGGQTFGIIRFGSRVDVYLPENVHPQVVEGQRMIGGETILADLASKAPARKGEPRP